MSLIGTYEDTTKKFGKPKNSTLNGVNIERNSTTGIANEENTKKQVGMMIEQYNNFIDRGAHCKNSAARTG